MASITFYHITVTKQPTCTAQCAGYEGAYVGPGRGVRHRRGRRLPALHLLSATAPLWPWDFDISGVTTCGIFRPVPATITSLSPRCWGAGTARRLGRGASTSEARRGQPRVGRGQYPGVCGAMALALKANISLSMTALNHGRGQGRHSGHRNVRGRTAQQQPRQRSGSSLMATPLTPLICQGGAVLSEILIDGSDFRNLLLSRQRRRRGQGCLQLIGDWK